MKEIAVHNKQFRLLYNASQIEKQVERIAEEIKKEYKDKSPLFISLLNGAFMFTSDLMKLLEIECDLTFVKLSSYDGMQSSGKVKLHFGLDRSIAGRHVVIIEDIIDSGATLNFFLDALKLQNPASMKVAAMFVKTDALKYPVTPDFQGLSIPDKFIIGYGLDYNGLGRNYKDVYEIKD